MAWDLPVNNPHEQHSTKGRTMNITSLQDMCIRSYINFVKKTLDFSETPVPSESFGPRKYYPKLENYHFIVKAHIQLLEGSLCGVASTNIRADMIHVLQTMRNAKKVIRDWLFFILFNEDVNEINLAEMGATLDQFYHLRNILHSKKKPKLKKLQLQTLQIDPTNPYYDLPKTLFSHRINLTSLTCLKLNVKIRNVVYSLRDDQNIEDYITAVWQGLSLCADIGINCSSLRQLVLAPFTNFGDDVLIWLLVQNPESMFDKFGVDPTILYRQSFENLAAWRDQMLSGIPKKLHINLAKRRFYKDNVLNQVTQQINMDELIKLVLETNTLNPMAKSLMSISTKKSCCPCNNLITREFITNLCPNVEKITYDCRF